MSEDTPIYGALTASQLEASAWSGYIAAARAQMLACWPTWEPSRDELVGLLVKVDAERRRLEAELRSALEDDDHEVIVLSIQRIAGDDGQWADEFLAWYKPEEWMGEHRAAQAFLAGKVRELRAAAQQVEDDAADAILGPIAGREEKA